jgi:uncharacterized protein YxeA
MGNRNEIQSFIIIIIIIIIIIFVWQMHSVHLLDRYNKIYKMHGTYTKIKRLKHFVM